MNTQVELLPHCPVHQRGRHRRVDAAGEGADRAAAPTWAHRGDLASTTLSVVQVPRSPACRAGSDRGSRCRARYGAPRGATGRRPGRARCPRTPPPGSSPSRRAQSKPGGASETESPWDIQTLWVVGHVGQERPGGAPPRRGSARTPTPVCTTSRRGRRHGLEAVADAEDRDARSNTAESTHGAPSGVHRLGPPDRIAAGRLAMIAATDAVCGMIYENTRALRTRRAMSWAYWAPKSMTMTGSWESVTEGKRTRPRPRAA